MIGWAGIFTDWADTAEPAMEEEIVHLRDNVLAPLTDPEVTALDDAWDFQATDRSLTTHPFSVSYVDFLRWSNGGTFQNGDRQFQMFAVSEIRNYLLDYGIPAFMQGAIPFAMDGGGSFYLFDMRKPPVDDEYPVLFNHCSELEWDESIIVGSSFLEACTCPTAPCDL